MTSRRSLRIATNSIVVGTLALALAACGGRGDRPTSRIAPAQVTQIGVNSYIWRAALDTLSFMALTQTDSNGGVITSDWYVNPATPGERVKVTVSVIGTDLRADALNVAMARQVNQGGQWSDQPVQAATVQKLEDIILTRARDLRRTAYAG